MKVCIAEKPSVAREIAAVLEDSYQEKTGIVPQIFASRPALGAHLVTE